ncbi:hypothetical protein U9M48_032587, partial [Paspalum notatum var. saurae]
MRESLPMSGQDDPDRRRVVFVTRRGDAPSPFPSSLSRDPARRCPLRLVIFFGRRDEHRSLVTRHPLPKMGKGRRHNITQSLDAYLSEDHVEDQNAQKTATSSPIQPGTTEDQLDTETNNEFTKNEEVTRRGKTKLKHVWNMPKGQRIVVKCNEVDQAVGEEAGVLGKFLGMVARNGCLCSLSYKDWRLLIGKKDRVTNELKNKEDILKQLKKRLLYPARMEKWILKTIAERWRQHKSNLKSMYFDVHKSKEANYSNVPPGVIDDQWVALVNNWMTLKAQDMSNANRINCAKKKGPHTTRTISFARKREEL